MKRRATGFIVCAVVAGLLLTPRKVYALFGEDVAVLLQIYSQAQQTYRLEQQTQQIARNTAAFFQHPNWRGMLTNAATSAQAAIAQHSNGYDAVSVRSIDESMRVANEAIRETQAQAQMSTANAGLISLLQLNQAQAKIERDRMATNLQFQADVDAYAQAHGTGLGNVSESIKGWSLK